MILLLAFLLLSSLPLHAESSERSSDTLLLYDWDKDNIADTFYVSGIEKPEDYSALAVYYYNLEIFMSNGSYFKLSDHVDLQNSLISINSIYNDILDSFSLLDNDYIRIFDHIEYNDYLKIFDHIEYDDYFKRFHPEKIKGSPKNIFLAIQIHNISIKDYDIFSDSLPYLPSLVIVRLNDNGKPELSLNKENFLLIDFDDSNYDMELEIIGLIKYPKEISENLLSYIPLHALTLKDGKFQVDSELSERYYDDEIDGWAGMEPRDDYLMVINPKLKKPKVLKYEDALKLEELLNK